MSIQSADETVRGIRGIARSAAREEAERGMGPKLATVVGVSPDGKVTVRYDGDGAPSQKALNKYTSYVPQLGDRVHVVNGVVAGGWRP